MRGHKGIDPEENRLLWAVYQFAVSAMIVGFILWPIWAWAEIERVWTDFSPKPEVNVIVIDDPQTDEVIVMIKDPIPEVKPEADLDKEKYRTYFEDKGLVLMVLGGVEYWKMNCGSLTSTGEYFVALAIKKHEIDEEEMHMDMSFQTGLFAATLYNSCDHFLGQVETIGLEMMFIKDDTYLIQGGELNNIQNSEV